VLSDSFVESAVKLKEYRGAHYEIVAQNITGLIPPGSTGINHGEWTKLNFTASLLFIGLAIGISTDGKVVLLTITVVKGA